MNTTRNHGARARRWLCLATLGLLAACGGEEGFGLDPEGIRRYGAPTETGEYGGKSLDVGVGEAVVAVASPSPDPRGGAGRAGGRRKSVKKYKVDAAKAAQGGSIRGVVRLDGQPNPLPLVPITKDQQACKHTEHPSRRLVYDEEKLTVENCYVYLRDIAVGKDWAGELAGDDRVAFLNQVECMYEPHVSVLRPDTQLQVGNADSVVHNIHGYRNTLLITQFNFFTQANSREDEVADAYLEKPGKYIVKCDVHPWMSAYLWVATNPYFFVTAIDGVFKLENVPAGTYELVCWHEGMQENPQFKDGSISGYDYGADWEDVKKVTVTASGEAVQDFVIPAPK